MGVGSLIVGDTSGKSDGVPGNMFVPIDLLPPIMADLIAAGRPSGASKPWIGINAEDVRGRLFVSRVTAGGPGEKAGIRRGDIIVGINGEAPKGLADFYRKLWALAPPAPACHLDVLQGATGACRRQSINRLDHLKLKSTFTPPPRPPHIRIPPHGTAILGACRHHGRRPHARYRQEPEGQRDAVPHLPRCAGRGRVPVPGVRLREEDGGAGRGTTRSRMPSFTLGTPW